MGKNKKAKQSPLPPEERQQLVRQYLHQGLSQTAISLLIGCHRNTIVNDIREIKAGDATFSSFFHATGEVAQSLSLFETLEQLSVKLAFAASQHHVSEIRHSKKPGGKNATEQTEVIKPIDHVSVARHVQNALQARRLRIELLERRGFLVQLETIPPSDEMRICDLDKNESRLLLK